MSEGNGGPGRPPAGYVGSGLNGTLTREDAQGLMEEFTSSGKGLKAFAEEKGMSSSRLGWWRTKFARSPRRRWTRRKSGLCSRGWSRPRKRRARAAPAGGGAEDGPDGAGAGGLRRAGAAAPRDGVGRSSRMLRLPPSVRVFVAVEAVDGRKGFDGLLGPVSCVYRRSRSLVPDQAEHPFRGMAITQSVTTLGRSTSPACCPSSSSLRSSGWTHPRA